MATITVTIPDTVIQRVLAAFSSVYGYQATLPDGSANPQTQAQFAKSQVQNYIKGVVAQAEAHAAAEAARVSALANVNSTITLT